MAHMVESPTCNSYPDSPVHFELMSPQSGSLDTGRLQKWRNNAAISLIVDSDPAINAFVLDFASIACTQFSCCQNVALTLGEDCVWALLGVLLDSEYLSLQRREGLQADLVVVQPRSPRSSAMQCCQFKCASILPKLSANTAVGSDGTGCRDLIAESFCHMEITPAMSAPVACQSYPTPAVEQGTETEVDTAIEFELEELRAELLVAREVATHLQAATAAHPVHAVEDSVSLTVHKKVMHELETMKVAFNELQAKLVNLRKQFEISGMGKAEVAKCFAHAGVEGYMKPLPSVFQRLYADGLRRMVTIAEKRRTNGVMLNSWFNPSGHSDYFNRQLVKGFSAPPAHVPPDDRPTVPISVGVLPLTVGPPARPNNPFPAGKHLRVHSRKEFFPHITQF